MRKRYTRYGNGRTQKWGATDVTKILGELWQECEQIERTIASLERLGRRATTETTKTLGELRQERDLTRDAFLALERLARSRGIIRGRRSVWMSKMAIKRRGRPPGSKNKTTAVASDRRTSLGGHTL
jgi:hypothetical protein